MISYNIILGKAEISLQKILLPTAGLRFLAAKELDHACLHTRVCAPN